MASTVVAVNNLLASGQYTSLLSLIKGFRNGIVYGAKIRFPHALVMTFLFKSGPLKEQARAILEATYMHSKNLASFVVTYRVLTLLMKELEGGKVQQYHAFISAFITGYLVFGKYNKINEQINLYLLSRILYGLAKLAVEKRIIPNPSGPVFPWFGAAVWGVVLWLFEYHRHTLQPSLRSSMTYLYDDSRVWHNIRDFIVYNK